MLMPIPFVAPETLDALPPEAVATVMQNKSRLGIVWHGHFGWLWEVKDARGSLVRFGWGDCEDDAFALCWKALHTKEMAHV